jgi:hypothetical protein
MSAILERAMKQYREKVEAAGILSIEVPQWQDESGNPTLIYFRPLSTLPVKDYSKVVYYATQETVEAGVDILIVRALNADKTPMFRGVERGELVRKVDSEVILDIIGRMGEQDSISKNTVEESEKN